MRKALKWIGTLLVGLIVIVILAAAALSFSTNARLSKTYTIRPAPLSIPTDSASIQAGQHLASIYYAGCHGADLAGKEFFNDPAIAVIDAPNLTAGNGGVGAQYSDTDWVRAIRHGVDRQGKALFIMPSRDFYYFSDEDLGRIIACLKSAPAVDNQANDFSNTFVGRVLVAVGAFGDVLNAETIDHNGPRPPAPAPAVSRAYGEYLVKTFGCSTCHGVELAGGNSPQPDAPAGPNLTPGGNLESWSQQDFINIVRLGQSEWMPFESLNKMSDDELTAIFLYLQSLPSLETATK